MPVDSSHAIKDSGFARVKRHLRPLPFRVVEGGLWPVVGLWPQEHFLAYFLTHV